MCLHTLTMPLPDMAQTKSAFLVCPLKLHSGSVLSRGVVEMIVIDEVNYTTNHFSSFLNLFSFHSSSKSS